MGLGASLPKEGEIKRLKIDTDEKLRRQILGKDYKKLQSSGTRLGVGSSSALVGHVGVKPRPTVAMQEADGSEDEGGRSSLGKLKRRKLHQQIGEIQAETVTSIKTRSPQKAANYLDEVLAERSRKRIKKSRKVKHSSQ